MAVIRQEDRIEDEDLESESDVQREGRGNGDEEGSQSQLVDLNDMKMLNPNLADFTFDHKRGEWCEIVLEVSLPPMFSLMVSIR